MILSFINIGKVPREVLKTEDYPSIAIQCAMLQDVLLFSLFVSIEVKIPVNNLVILSY